MRPLLLLVPALLVGGALIVTLLLDGPDTYEAPQTGEVDREAGPIPGQVHLFGDDTPEGRLTRRLVGALDQPAGHAFLSTLLALEEGGAEHVPAVLRVAASDERWLRWEPTPELIGCLLTFLVGYPEAASEFATALFRMRCWRLSGLVWQSVGLPPEAEQMLRSTARAPGAAGAWAVVLLLRAEGAAIPDHSAFPSHFSLGNRGPVAALLEEWGRQPLVPTAVVEHLLRQSGPQAHPRHEAQLFAGALARGQVGISDVRAWWRKGRAAGRFVAAAEGFARGGTAGAGMVMDAWRAQELDFVQLLAVVRTTGASFSTVDLERIMQHALAAGERAGALDVAAVIVSRESPSAEVVAVVRSALDASEEPDVLKVLEITCNLAEHQPAVVRRWGPLWDFARERVTPRAAKAVQVLAWAGDHDDRNMLSVLFRPAAFRDAPPDVLCGWLAAKARLGLAWGEGDFALAFASADDWRVRWAARDSLQLTDENGFLNLVAREIYGGVKLHPLDLTRLGEIKKLRVDALALLDAALPKLSGHIQLTHLIDAYQDLGASCARRRAAWRRLLEAYGEDSPGLRALNAAYVLESILDSTCDEPELERRCVEAIRATPRMGEVEFQQALRLRRDRGQ